MKFRVTFLLAVLLTLVPIGLTFATNESNALGDVSWMKPGKDVGIRWAMHIDHKTWGSGSRHGATTEEAKRDMDFAAESVFDGVRVEGWNTGWDGDWFNTGADADWTTMPYSMAIENRSVKRGVAMDLRLTAGGGAAIQFRALIN